MKSEINNLIGTIVPKEDPFKKRMRIHQAWWRTFVLLEEEGFNPSDNNRKVCNTITHGKDSKKNFLTENIRKSVLDTLDGRNQNSRGMINEERLYNNLLSSQPLCFNFFGEMKQDLNLALLILKDFYPDIDKVTDVMFEYSPSENFTDDNSAFDVAFEVKMNGKTGLIGWECKYTDSFSNSIKDKAPYREVYNKSSAFLSDYESFFKTSLRQLFRNQLIAEACIINKKYDFVYTGLFCHTQDTASIKTGREFQGMLKDGINKFNIVTYNDFIKGLQKHDVSWEIRQLSMMLWARYCALSLSQEVYESISYIQKPITSSISIDQLSNKQVVRKFEGGVVYSASNANKYYIIEDEGTLLDLLDEEDLKNSKSLTRVYEFSSKEDMDIFVSQKYS